MEQMCANSPQSLIKLNYQEIPTQFLMVEMAEIIISSLPRKTDPLRND